MELKRWVEGIVQIRGTTVHVGYIPPCHRKRQCIGVSPCVNSEQTAEYSLSVYSLSNIINHILIKIMTESFRLGIGVTCARVHQVPSAWEIMIRTQREAPGAASDCLLVPKQQARH